MTYEPLREATCDEAAGIARSFMDEEEAIEFAQTHVANPDLTLVCRDNEGSILGVCYGRISRKNHATLQMISVKREYAGRGFGSQLLRRFEVSCAARGCISVGMGSSSEEYVERFYLKNGYAALEYWISFHEQPPSGSLDGLEVQRPRKVGDQFFVNIAADGYDVARKGRLKRQLNASDVGYVFRKELQPHGGR